MTKLRWNAAGERIFETGVDRGVLYSPGSSGVAWNGITAVSEKRSGTLTPLYIDGVLYANLPAVSDFEATLKAFTYPREFLPFDGVAGLGKGMYVDNQVPRTFGLSWRTLIGNDIQGKDFAYLVHVAYDLTASPSDKDYATLSDEISPGDFSWNIAGIPQRTATVRPSAHFWFDSRETHPLLLAELEDILYGTPSTAPSLPALSDLVALVASWALITITDNGDGTWSATGPDAYFTVTDDEFTITEVTGSYSDPDTYNITTG